ncbi:hypothetical protein [Acidianus sp. HS-5]|uniref:hypothetical protein n=1 Tax=Acidianus sp. HS-5 TaxID=2886040 RepID=UPI001F21676B|nr:hypothetical protein [Acidianus sp. HS-5]BDC19118.1 hypothetical protein HS5_20080 [Acidianus sp. HS-5]
MEKTFQINNADINGIHDKLMNELQNRGFEIHRDEPRDNGFKVFVRRGEEHGEVEVFNDWDTVKLITHGELEWDLMNTVEPLINQEQVPSISKTPNMQSSPTVHMQQPSPPQTPPMQDTPSVPPQQQFPRPSPMQYGIPQPPTPQQSVQPSMYYPAPQLPTSQGGLPEHMQIVNILTQSGYQIEVNTVNGQIFFVRGRKGNYVIDIEGRPQP